MVAATLPNLLIQRTTNTTSSGYIPNLGSFLEISSPCCSRDAEEELWVVEWAAHNMKNPIFANPSKGMATLWGFFWFVGIPLPENSFLNFTVMVHESWKATVAAIENQQKCINSMVLQTEGHLTF
jgi:hypothetical protein